MQVCGACGRSCAFRPHYPSPISHGLDRSRGWSDEGLVDRRGRTRHTSRYLIRGSGRCQGWTVRRLVLAPGLDLNLPCPSAPAVRVALPPRSFQATTRERSRDRLGHGLLGFCRFLSLADTRADRLSIKPRAIFTTTT